MTSETLPIYSLAFKNGMPLSALKVAVVVGSILNLINQGDAIFGEAPVEVLKLLLTYTVPYCVYTYGCVTMQLRMCRSEGNTV